METQKKIVLIDDYSILNRAFYDVPELTNSTDLHTSVIYGFLNILLKLLGGERANYLAVAFNLPAPAFRYERYAAYKGTRKPMPEELREQVPLLKKLLGAMHTQTISLEGFETGDMIGTLAKHCRRERYEVTVVSGDRDLLRLADRHILIRLPKTSCGRTEILDFTPEAVRETYGVTLEEFIDIKALMGDTSDNIPGVPSIGKKTTTALIQGLYSTENLKEHLGEMKPPRAKKALEEHFEDAVFSKWLATIYLNTPLALDLPSLKFGEIYTTATYGRIQRLEFHSLLKRFGSEVQREDMCAQQKPKLHLLQNAVELREVLRQTAEAPEIGIARDDLLISPYFRAEKAMLSYRHKPEEAEREKAKVLAGAGEGTVLTGTAEQSFLKALFRQAKRVSALSLKELIKAVGTAERENVNDLDVLTYLVNPLKESYQSEDLARDYLSLPLPSVKKDVVTTTAYAGYVVFATRQSLCDKVKELDMEMLCEIVERPLIFMLAEMEETGVRVDAEKLKAFSEELETEIHRIETEILEETGENSNLNPLKQLGEILFEKMKLPYGKKTKGGYSTAADILEKLALEYPVIKKILRYRMLTKLNSTYTVGLAGFIRADDRVRSTFRQAIAATGRISLANPNLQNIPIQTEIGSRVRAVFVPSPGKVFMGADYSQIELRILAVLSSDEDLIATYRGAISIHAVTASQVFHVPPSGVTPLQRQSVKAVDFGMVYSISAFGLSEGSGTSRNEAKEYISRYFATYPEVRHFLDRWIKEAKGYGFTRTLFDRIRPVPGLKDSSSMQRSFDKHVAMNASVQGTATDIIKIAIVKIRRALAAEKLDARIVLQIHDKLPVEAAEAEAPHVLELLGRTIRCTVKLHVLLEVDAHIGASRLEAH